MVECSFQLLLCRCLMGALIVCFVKGKTCWDSTWYNSSSPAVNGGSDVETVNITVLNTLCANGPVVAAHCRDEKGEPFSGLKNDTSNHYIANCTVDNGLQCHPYTSTVGASCADFAIQYGCNCPTTKTTTTTTISTSPSKSASSIRQTTTKPTGRASLTETTTPSKLVFEKWEITGAECTGAKLQIGTWCVTWWIPLLVVSGSLFAINIVVSGCLYKASIAKRTRSSRIHPLS